MSRHEQVSSAGEGHPSRFAWIVVVLLVLPVAWHALGMYGDHRTRKWLNDVSLCQSNLAMIRLAIEEYARGNGGACPDTLRELVEKGHLHPSCLRCPAAKDEAAGAYVYVGRGKAFDALGPWPVAFDQGRHHGADRGVLAIWADGSNRMAQEQELPPQRPSSAGSGDER